MTFCVNELLTDKLFLLSLVFCLTQCMGSAENIAVDSVWPNTCQQKIASYPETHGNSGLVWPALHSIEVQMFEMSSWHNLFLSFYWQAVLETIRNLMNTDCVVPDWLHDIILGYGDPSSAHYSKMPNQIATLDFNDTFLSIEHLKTSFPGHNVKVTVDDPALQIPPFR